MATTKTGKTVSRRAKQLREWVTATYAKRPAANLTSRRVATAATVALGWPVGQNRVARELDRQGISFRREASDPPPAVWSKTELLRVRVEALEERLTALEAHVGPVQNPGRAAGGA